MFIFVQISRVIRLNFQYEYWILERIPTWRETQTSVKESQEESRGMPSSASQAFLAL